MFTRRVVCLSSASLVFILSGCASPFDVSTDRPTRVYHLTKPGGAIAGGSIFRDQERSDEDHAKRLEGVKIDPTAESFVSYALFHSPEVERAYQRWRSASERLPQVRALPDPRLKLGFFLNEVETRVGPQQAKIGLSQTFPWIGKLQDREDAAGKGALAAWYQYQEAMLGVSERVLKALYDLGYLDSAIKITQENTALLHSFEEVVRARYRVGAGSHPELIRVQVELGQIEDRVEGLKALRPSYTATLNAALNRPGETPVATIPDLPDWVVSTDAEQVMRMAIGSSPTLEAIRQRVEQARIGTDLARKDGYPDLTVGVDYVVTDQARNPAIPESGDDPIMLSFGLNLPIWREKYDAEIRESIAKRLSMSRTLDASTNALSAQVYQAWFEHTDADRRVRLFKQTLIPKAQESLSASLVGFRTGDSAFLDLLDTERTLLEFSLDEQRARADRGKALATLNRLVGRSVPVTNDNAQPAELDTNKVEVQP